ncbi:hypothetical protein N0V82_006005 [Gnomoniopsis sp. IMI 355080]|nr:hypothetical protein N0V82_006005 [Gnomoniopsis sp. IMI 355080]
MAELTSEMEGLKLAVGLAPPASPESPALSPPSNATVVDKDGDLYIVVGSEKRAFQVDSRALVRVSSVWKSMLTGNWAESRPSVGAWIVNFPSDDPYAIEILLHIIHLNTRQIPRAGSITIGVLFRVAVAVDMYDLEGCLGLWAKSWCSAVAPVVEATKDVEALARLSWIAWVFGDKSLFQGSLDRLVMELEVDGEGGLVGIGGLDSGDMEVLKAMDLLDHLATTRTQLITSLLAVLESTLQTAINTSRTAIQSPFCRSTAVSGMSSDSARYKVRADCTAAILGSMIQSLAAEELFPYPESPEDIFESAGALRHRLVRVVEGIQTLGIPNGTGTAFIDESVHAGCNPKKRLLKWLDAERPRCAPTQAQIRHLEETAERIGVGESARRA